ncbi:hypothetical protein PIB30_115309, partial [Stylosanthes scabra]|nr:hypothetical protein [Stylosanthes scabra]
IIEKERERLLLPQATKHHQDSKLYTMNHISTRCFQQERYFRNSFFKRMRISSTPSDTKSTIGSGRSSQSRFKPLAISWLRNFMLMLGSRTKQRGSIPLTLQV